MFSSRAMAFLSSRAGVARPVLFFVFTIVFVSPSFHAIGLYKWENVQNVRGGK
jgi:hypothetical protein